jgi:hypothetical protein
MLRPFHIPWYRKSWWYFMKCTSYEATNYAAFFTSSVFVWFVWRHCCYLEYIVSKSSMIYEWRMGREIVVTYLRLFSELSVKILKETAIDLSPGHDSYRASAESSSGAFSSSLFGLTRCSANSEIPSIYKLPLLWDTKFHTHIKISKICLIFHILFLGFLDMRWNGEKLWIEWFQAFAELNFLSYITIYIKFWTQPPFWWRLYSTLHFGEETWIYTLHFLGLFLD